MNKSFRTAMGAAVLAAAICLAAFSPAATARAGDLQTRHKFTIPAQSLETALLAFSNQAKVQVLMWAESKSDVKSSGAMGELRALDALDAILANTGLGYKQIDKETVAIVKPDGLGESANVGPPLRLAQSDSPSPQDSGQQPRSSAENTQNSKDQSAASLPSAEGKEQESKLEEIVVTAQLREEKLKDIPMSISAVTGAALEKQHITNITDLAYTVPDLDVAPIGPGQQIIAIRGLSGERGSSSLTGVYLDNIPVSGLQDSFLQTYPDIEMYDLQRVEVLKGPQGTLFGEGAVGGVVRFLTNDPDLSKYGGRVTTTLFGTLDGKMSGGVIGVVNLPLARDEFALRLAAHLENDSGWIDAPLSGRRDINNDRTADGRVEALWKPVSDLSISGLVVNHNSLAGASDIVNYGPPQKSEFMQAIDPGAPTNLWDRYTMSNLSIKYDFGFAELLSSTSHIDRSSEQNFTQVFGGTPYDHSAQILEEGYFQKNTTTSQEFRLTSLGDTRLKWVVGGIYKDTQLVSNHDAEPQYYSLFSGTDTFVVPAGPATANESKSLAGYGNISYKFTDEFEMGGGLRYFHDARAAFEPGVGDSRETATFTVPTYRYYASYNFTEEIKAYVNVGTGFRSGGFNDFSDVAIGAPATFGPEHDTSYEIGMKSTFFDRQIGFDAAFFYSRYTDLQDDVLGPAAGGEIVQYTGNAQDANIDGFEWSTSWKAPGNIVFEFAGDILHSRITKASPVSSYFLGSAINYVPRYSITVGADYNFNWSSRIAGFAHVDVNRKGRSTDTFNTLEQLVGTPDVAVAPAVTFLNASVGANYNDWTFTLFGRNLTNELNYIRAGTSGLTPQARPLSIGITVDRAF